MRKGPRIAQTLPDSVDANWPENTLIKKKTVFFEPRLGQLSGECDLHKDQSAAENEQFSRGYILFYIKSHKSVCQKYIIVKIQKDHRWTRRQESRVLTSWEVGAWIDFLRTRCFPSGSSFTKQMDNACLTGHKSGFGFKQSLCTVMLT